MLIDCHAHLASSAFATDRPEVLERAHRAGVEAVLVVGQDFEDNERVQALVAAEASGTCRLFPCFGLHPDRIADDRPLPDEADIARIEEQIRSARSRLSALGEVGLDFFYAKAPDRRAAQVALLERLARLAIELDLPLNVHSRSAGHYAIDTLRSAGARRVLMHAFDGKFAYAEKAASEGYLFSIPPSLVRSEQKQNLVRRLPLEALALESDAPVLGPSRTERNEPSNLPITVAWLAKLHGVSEERIAEITTANAARLFPSVFGPVNPP